MFDEIINAELAEDYEIIESANSMLDENEKTLREKYYCQIDIFSIFSTTLCKYEDPVCIKNNIPLLENSDETLEKNFNVGTPEEIENCIKIYKRTSDDNNQYGIYTYDYTFELPGVNREKSDYEISTNQIIETNTTFAKVVNYYAYRENSCLEYAFVDQGYDDVVNMFTNDPEVAGVYAVHEGGISTAKALSFLVAGEGGAALKITGIGDILSFSDSAVGLFGSYGSTYDETTETNNTVAQYKRDRQPFYNLVHALKLKGTYYTCFDGNNEEYSVNIATLKYDTEYVSAAIEHYKDDEQVNDKDEVTIEEVNAYIYNNKTSDKMQSFMDYLNREYDGK